MNFEKLTEYLDSLEEKYGIPANDCKVTKEHEVIYRKVTGHADYKSQSYVPTVFSNKTFYNDSSTPACGAGKTGIV